MRKKLIPPNKKELQEFYFNVKSISKTAKQYNTTNPTIRKWLKEYSIPIFTQKEAVIRDFELKRIEIPEKEELQYFYKNFSIKDLCQLYNVGQQTIYEWLELHNIEKNDFRTKIVNVKSRLFNDRFSFLTKEKIEEDYKKIQCMSGLANHYNCSISSLKKIFQMYNIETKFAKNSIGQLEVEKFIKNLGFDIITNDRKLIYPFEIDIIVPDKKLAIEYCGIYFHSQTFGNKEKNYHLNKQILCEKAGYNLITIFENEWMDKKDIVKSLLTVKLGVVTNKIPARKTEFKEITYKEIKEFEKENHLQGTRQAKYYYGLFHKNEIVMGFSVGKSRFNKNIEFEVIRMTTKKNTIIIGGLSKILKNIKLKNCLTYADKRYGDGNGYEKCGFKKLKDSPPNYYYFHKNDANKLFSRNVFQKHKIKDIDKTKTEYENMLLKGYGRIWDCGNSVFVL